MDYNHTIALVGRVGAYALLAAGAGWFHRQRRRAKAAAAAPTPTPSEAEGA
jgi:hypothetical protein